VVPTFNSGRFLKECLRSIREQTYENIEIIVVDSYSSDDTRKIAEKFGAKVMEIEARRSRARSAGAEKARGDLILSLDSDMQLTPTVVEKCVGKVEDGFDAVIIPEVSVGVGFWAKCKALEKACYIGDESIEASRFFKRETFEAAKGYDPELEAGEDWDLNQRIRKARYIIGRINVFAEHHEGRLSLWKSMKKKYQYGKTLEKYWKKHPDEAKQQLRLPRPSFVKNWRKLAGDPVHAFGMIFMKSCEFGAGLVGSLAVAKIKGSRSDK